MHLFEDTVCNVSLTMSQVTFDGGLAFLLVLGGREWIEYVYHR